ncbi:hypothetical protein LOK49_LG01G00907 [Camellia lanceoleosa]|uniref:Uncharacterized protein n=1 Tax=Camellia lanceoleosa TaxID=1840588 RepID=A0ACC0IY31_9ERIC|nr:hypothetical protein LOK49_LG01G00907 [Camellia lanceoleosa]
MNIGVEVQKVSEVIAPIHKTWDEAKIRTLVADEDCDAILSIPVAVMKGNNTIVWHHDSKGCYMVKSGELGQDSDLLNGLDGLKHLEVGAQGHGPHWVPPSRGKWKFNCDAETDLSRGRGAVAVLLRDEKGHLVDGIGAKIRLATAIQVEASVVRLACAMARALNYSNMEIDNDCKNVIQLCIRGGSSVGHLYCDE